MASNVLSIHRFTLAQHTIFETKSHHCIVSLQEFLESQMSHCESLEVLQEERKYDNTNVYQLTELPVIQEGSRHHWNVDQTNSLTLVGVSPREPHSSYSCDRQVKMQVRWNLSKMVTVLGSHLSKTASVPGPQSTKHCGGVWFASALKLFSLVRYKSTSFLNTSPQVTL